MLYARKLADMLHAEAAVEDGLLPSGEEDRLVHLVNLHALWDAVQVAGWNEHTGDWDWFVDLYLADGRELRDCITWEFSDAGGNQEPLEKMTACCQYPGFGKADDRKIITHLYVEYQDEQGEQERTELVPISQIVRLGIREEH